jgi:hypothetical protein
MGLADLLNSKRSGQISTLTMIVEAGLALYRGDMRVAALFLGGAALAYQWSAAGIIANVLINIYQRLR